MFAAAQILSGIVTVCLPLLARAGTEYFIMGRIILGIAQVQYQFELNCIIVTTYANVSLSGRDFPVHSAASSQMGANGRA